MIARASSTPLTAACTSRTADPFPSPRSSTAPGCPREPSTGTSRRRTSCSWRCCGRRPMPWQTGWTASQANHPAGRPSSPAAGQLAAWVEMMFDLAYDPQLRMHLTVIDSDEVRAAKGYRETRERLHAARERSLAQVLARARDDGSFPLTDPARDAVSISAVVSRELTISAPGDAAELQRARARVLDFALRALGARRLP